VLLDGRDTAEMDSEALRRSMGYVIQSTGLFPNMTIRRNVATVPRLLRWERERIDARVNDMLALVGLDPALYAAKYPHELSGGEAQRVGVARALAADPPVLLMDEPFGAVDPITREHLQVEMKRIQRELRKTVVFVTHDIDEAIMLADRIVLLREGRIEQSGTPEELWRHPASDFVRDFFGENLGLRIMARHCLSSVALEPLAGDGSWRALPQMPETATLKEALAELVGSGAERLVVISEGTPVGAFGFPQLVVALGAGLDCADGIGQPGQGEPVAPDAPGDGADGDA
jgi:osmoprotectant transport system ATP-binding protein